MLLLAFVMILKYESTLWSESLEDPWMTGSDFSTRCARSCTLNIGVFSSWLAAWFVYLAIPESGSRMSSESQVSWSDYCPWEMLVGGVLPPSPPAWAQLPAEPGGKGSLAGSDLNLDKENKDRLLVRNGTAEESWR